jgi:linoleoyl-CoA desaturase
MNLPRTRSKQRPILLPAINLVSWLVGGLNFQIEHHLFPKISHVHYPAISEIVSNVCREYQLQYIEYPTMRKAVVAHVRFLRQMGRHD